MLYSPDAEVYYGYVWFSSSVLLTLYSRNHQNKQLKLNFINRLGVGPVWDLYSGMCLYLRHIVFAVQLEFPSAVINIFTSGCGEVKRLLLLPVMLMIYHALTR